MMHKKSLLIICFIICLFSIASVCASDINETVVASENQGSEVLNVENQDISVVNATENEVLSTSSDDEVIAVCDDGGDVLTVENNGVSVAVCDDDGDVLTVENNNVSVVACDDDGDVLTVENNDETLAVSIPSTSTVQSSTNYKTFTIGTFKFPIKYLKFANGYKPSKKNKKLWKQYKSYKKFSKKATKKLAKQAIKVILKATKNHWHSYGNVYYRYYVSGKNIVYICYQKAYRTYNYNWVTDEEWWD